MSVINLAEIPAWDGEAGLTGEEGCPAEPMIVRFSAKRGKTQCLNPAF